MLFSPHCILVFVPACASASTALLELSVAMCMRSLKGFEANWKTKTSGSPGFLCVRLQVCVNAPLPEHFHGCCIKRKLYLHVFDSYLLKKCDPFAPVKSFGSCVEALLPVMHGQYRAPLLRMNWSSFLLQQVSSSCDTLHSSTIMGQLKTDSKKKDGKGSAPYRSLTVVLQQFWHPRTRVFYNHFGFPSWG